MNKIEIRALTFALNNANHKAIPASGLLEYLRRSEGLTATVSQVLQIKGPWSGGYLYRYGKSLEGLQQEQA